jgi:hypothetical protein
MDFGGFMTDKIQTEMPDLREQFDKLWRESGLIDEPTIAETEAAFKGYRLALSQQAEPFGYVVVQSHVTPDTPMGPPEYDEWEEFYFAEDASESIKAIGTAVYTKPQPAQPTPVPAEQDCATSRWAIHGDGKNCAKCGRGLDPLEKCGCEEKCRKCYGKGLVRVGKNQEICWSCVPGRDARTAQQCDTANAPQVYFAGTLNANREQPTQQGYPYVPLPALLAARAAALIGELMDKVDAAEPGPSDSNGDKYRMLHSNARNLLMRRCSELNDALPEWAKVNESYFAQPLAQQVAGTVDVKLIVDVVIVELAGRKGILDDIDEDVTQEIYESLHAAISEVISSAPSEQDKVDAIEAEPVTERGAVYGIIDPDYGRWYTIIRKLAWEEGYAIGMHGSFTRDLDVIAVPWADRVCEPEHLVRRICASIAGLRSLPSNPGTKPHGRLVWTLVPEAFGDPRFVDLSIIPAQAAAARAAQEKANDK